MMRIAKAKAERVQTVKKMERSTYPHDPDQEKCIQSENKEDGHNIDVFQVVLGHEWAIQGRAGW